MKKLVFTLLILLVFPLVLAACGGEDEEFPNEIEDTSPLTPADAELSETYERDIKNLDIILTVQHPEGWEDNLFDIFSLTLADSQQNSTRFISDDGEAMSEEPQVFYFVAIEPDRVTDLTTAEEVFEERGDRLWTNDAIFGEPEEWSNDTFEGIKMTAENEFTQGHLYVLKHEDHFFALATAAANRDDIEALAEAMLDTVTVEFYEEE